jgi:hypothetical protein
MLQRFCSAALRCTPVAPNTTLAQSAAATLYGMHLMMATTVRAPVHCRWMSSSIPNRNNNHAKNNNNGKKATLSVPIVATSSYVDTHVHLDMIMKRSNISLPITPTSFESYRTTHFPPSSLCEAVVHISCNAPDLPFGEQIIKSHPSFVYGAFGIHPHHADV